MVPPETEPESPKVIEVELKNEIYTKFAALLPIATQSSVLPDLIVLAKVKRQDVTTPVPTDMVPFWSFPLTVAPTPQEETAGAGPLVTTCAVLSISKIGLLEFETVEVAIAKRAVLFPTREKFAKGEVVARPRFPFPKIVRSVALVVEATVKSGSNPDCCAGVETESWENGVVVPTPIIPFVFINIEEVAIIVLVPEKYGNWPIVPV